MKATHSKSVLSDLILACFILSIFLLLENRKESNASTSVIETSSKIEFTSLPDTLTTMENPILTSYILE